MKLWLRCLLLSALLAQGCAVAPLSNHVTARTNGKGENLASIGSTIDTKKSGWLPSLKYSIGLQDDLDLGFQYEVIEWGAWAKYALVNNREEGFSLAGLVGLGLGADGGYYGYLGPIVSWKLGWFEPYLMTRFNYVRYEESSVAVTRSGEFTVKPGTYRYFQHTLGFLTWPLDWFGVGLEVSTFGTVRSPFILEGKSRYLLSGNFSFRF
jgi:hypothetical protein